MMCRTVLVCLWELIQVAVRSSSRSSASAGEKVVSPGIFGASQPSTLPRRSASTRWAVDCSCRMSSRRGSCSSGTSVPTREAISRMSCHRRFRIRRLDLDDLVDAPGPPHRSGQLRVVVRREQDERVCRSSPPRRAAAWTPGSADADPVDIVDDDHLRTEEFADLAPLTHIESTRRTPG